MVSAARASGYWSGMPKFIDTFDLGYFPRHNFLAIATGSQGEPRAALHRLARDTHPDLTLEAGDTVVFSSRVIPGNEKPVENLVKLLEQRGIKVIAAERHPPADSRLRPPGARGARSDVPLGATHAGDTGAR